MINGGVLKMFQKVPIIRGFTEIEDLVEICEQFNAVICGGYVRYMCSPRKNPVQAKDVDVFPKSERSFNDLKQHFLEVKGFTVKHENNVSLTLEAPKGTIWEYCPVIQLIKPVKEGAIVTLGTLEEILENFDFTVVRAGLLSSTFALVDEDFLSDEKKMVLRLKNIHCPVSSLLRCMKYGNKGYFLRPMEAMKLFMDWDNRSNEYKSQLVEFFDKSRTEDKWTREEIDQLEVLLRVD